MTVPEEFRIKKKQLLKIGGIKDPVTAQNKVLKKLIKKAVNTEFGSHYQFSKILTSKDLVRSFQHSVPLHDYNKIYDDWWYKILQGNKNITWPGKTKYFALSSGTSQAGSKKIPVTQAMLKALKRGAFRIFTRIGKFENWETILTKSWLAIGGSAELIRENGHFLGYLSGINANKRPIWARIFYKPGEAIGKIQEWDDRVKVIAKQAPKWDISMLIGIPHWIQIVLEEIIRFNNLKSIKEIWPDLELIVTGGVAFAPYKASFEKLIGQPIKSLDTYLASEGLIAVQEKPYAPLQLMLKNDIFFEFVPFIDENYDDNGDLIGNPIALTIKDVVPGIDYALYISTCAGAWRYMIGDTIRFVNDDKKSIVISGRTKHYLNLVTEHVTVDNLNAAIQMVQEQFSLNIPEYTVAGIHQPGLIMHRWYVSPDREIEVKLLREAIDNSLKQVNDDYRSERATILQMDLEVIPVEYFQQWQLKQSGAAGQSKVPRVMKGRQLESWQKYLDSRRHGP